MCTNWIKKITGSVRLYIEVVLVLVMMIFIFDIIIQPILISIDPMFSDQYAETIEWRGRYPDSPAGIAFVVSYAAGFAVYKYGRIFIAGVTTALSFDGENSNGEEIGVFEAIGGTFIAMMAVLLPRRVNDWIFKWL